jgi:hypothetical protein
MSRNISTGPKDTSLLDRCRWNRLAATGKHLQRRHLAWTYQFSALIKHDTVKELVS